MDIDSLAENLYIDYESAFRIPLTQTPLLPWLSHFRRSA
jgi:hypothetical protein